MQTTISTQCTQTQLPANRDGKGLQLGSIFPPDLNKNGIYDLASLSLTIHFNFRVLYLVSLFIS